MSENLKAEIGNLVESLTSSLHRENIERTQDQLEEYWFFKWDESKPLDWNIYQFTDLLELYRRQCRRWEEYHNGSCCVVERVRDQYLMPKIKAFRQRLAQEISMAQL